MAKPNDTKIEKTLRKTVQEALKNGEEVKVTLVRKRTEGKLGLEEGSLKEGDWRDKSKAIIQEEFQKPAESAEQPVEKVKKSAPKPQKKSKKNDEQARPAGSDKVTDQTPKPPEGTAPKVNGVKRKAAEVEATPRSESDGSAASTAKTAEESPSKKAKITTPAPTKKDANSDNATSSGSEESSEDEDDSGSGSGSSGSDDEEVRNTESPTKTTEAAQDDSIQAIPSETFKAPSGYTSVDSALLSSDGSFTNANLEGKQIWHITASSNVPLSSLTELALSSIHSGELVLSHKNVPYVLSEDKTVGAESTALLAPTAQGYRKTQGNISRTLRLQQKIDLPNLSGLQASQLTGSNAAGDIAQASVSNVRPQPKGLRMRFKPPGFGKGKLGRIGSGSESGGEDEGEETGPSFQFPKTLGQHGVEVRQDGDVEMVDAAAVETLVANGDKHEKKAKKKRKEKEGGRAGGEEPEVNGHSVSKATSGVEASVEAPTPAKDLPNGTGAEKESKEEKRRRKEEKRARKEAKAQGK